MVRKHLAVGLLALAGLFAVSSAYAAPPDLFADQLVTIDQSSPLDVCSAPSMVIECADLLMVDDVALIEEPKPDWSQFTSELTIRNPLGFEPGSLERIDPGWLFI